MFSRRKVAALGAEFLGTGILAFLVLTLSRSQLGFPYFVAIAAGLAFGLMGIVMGRDVQLNPALTFGLWAVRRISTVKAVLFIAAQLLGSEVAYLLYKWFTVSHMVAPLQGSAKASVMVAEAVGAFVFAFGAASALYRQQNPLVRSVVSGTSYTIGVMVASVGAAGFINPAVANASNSWDWGTYAAGPLLGALIGVLLYALVFAERGTTATAKATATTAPASTRTETTSSRTAVTKTAAAKKSPSTSKAKKAKK